MMNRGQINHDTKNQPAKGRFSNDLLPRVTPRQDLRAMWIRDGLFLFGFQIYPLEIADH
jgi:hypothetical protein